MPDRTGDLSDAELDRLLAHVATVDTAWFRLASWLVDVGRRGCPEDRDSRNPAKWLLAELGSRMADAQHEAVNRRLARSVSRTSDV